MESPQVIKNQVDAIEKYIKENKKRMSEKELQATLEVIYEDFNTEYPIIFKKILNGTLEKRQFSYMLAMLEKIKNNELSQHDASVNVGQVLVDKYVKPVLKDHPSEKK
jgi:hypothetical protein